jgi:hypothetical protein
MVDVSVMEDDTDLPVGSTIATWDSNAVTTKADGAFALRVDAAEVPERFLPADAEYVNFDVRAVSGKDLATWSWTLWRVQPGGVWRTEGASADDGVAEVRLEFGRHPTIEQVDSSGQRETHELPVASLG